MGRQMHMRYEKNRNLRAISRFISEMIQNRTIIIMEDWQEIVYNLSTGATFSDLE